ncbi:MAG: hypothetical protein R3E32_19130 [Chitinophagales bacterium]
MKFIKNTHLFIVLIALCVVSCTKQDSIIDTSLNTQSHDIIDVSNEEFIDGVSQADVIVPIDLEVQVRDGMMIFKDHTSFIHAMDVLFEHNLESIEAWERQIGFKSLFTELARIEELPLEDMQRELKKGRLEQVTEIKTFEGEPFLECSMYSRAMSMVLNTDALVQVDAFIGTIGQDITIWTMPKNKEELIQAFDTREKPIGKEFIIDDGRFFEHKKDFAVNTSCTKNALWHSGTNTFVNPDANRRIDTRFIFSPITTNRSNGNKDYTCKFSALSTSRKSSCCKYKTDHYWAIDIETTTFDPATGNTAWTANGTTTNQKHGGDNITIVTYQDVSQSFLITNGISLVEAYPNNQNGQGTKLSHRGMDGDYARFTCD